jgi:hypothetical protein
MKLDLRQKRELISGVLLAGAALCAVLILVKATGFWVTLASADGIVNRAMAATNAEGKDINKVMAKNQSVAQQLKTKNLFAPPPPKEHPVKTVAGIFGDEALVNGQWIKVGGSVGDAQVLAIGPASVTVTWNGREKVFLPIDGSGSETSKGPQPKRTVRMSRGPSGPGQPALVVSKAGKKPLPPGKVKVVGDKPKDKDAWAVKMSVDDLRKTREKIQGYIRGLRAKGVTDPAQYRGAREKMQVVERALEERKNGK